MNRVFVEALIPAPVEVVWDRTQDPAKHERWDLRFDQIRYLPREGEMDYRTRIGFGVQVRGYGRYLSNEPLARSTFEFDSHDWKSLITSGRGLWLYQRRGGATFFKTVYDYRVRHGLFGRAVDAAFFRPLIQLATEWSFETLRRWCAGDDAAPARRRSWAAFSAWFASRRLGRPPRDGEARSWLG
jgi:hypothetical protein